VNKYVYKFTARPVGLHWHKLLRSYQWAAAVFSVGLHMDRTFNVYFY